jgi:hypothetical protein
MGSLKDLVNGHPFHSRSIEMKTYALERGLTHLLTVMSQAAFQGHVAHKRKSRQPLPASLEAVEGLDALLGSCRAWRRGGPKVTHLK